MVSALEQGRTHFDRHEWTAAHVQLAQADHETSLEPADEDERLADEVPVDAPIPPSIVPSQRPQPEAAPAPREAASRRPATNGIQRYGEAVVRQMLGATFVREEPYETGTRFN